MTAKTAGSVWLWPYEGDKGALWPVILSDDDVPPKVFMESRKNGFHQPAILLGKRIWIWVALSRLEPIDPAKNYTDGKEFENNDIQASDTPQEQLEKLRRVAFTVDVKDPRSPAFYQNYIVQRSAERKLEAVMRAKANKRRRSRDDDDDDDIQIIGSRRRSSGNSRSPTADYLPTPKSNVKKRKRSTNSHEQEVFVEEPIIRQSNHLDDPLHDDGRRETRKKLESRTGQSANR